MLLNNIKPIKYNKDNIIIDENNENMLLEVFWTNILNKNLDKNPEIKAAAIGLKIQLEISKTMQETFKSLVRYNIVLRIVVKNNANKYALNPYTGTRKYIMEIFKIDSTIFILNELICSPRAFNIEDMTIFKYMKGHT